MTLTFDKKRWRSWYAIDSASAQLLGIRDRQEDALISDFSLGAPCGFAVLSDGMGGHAAGEVASRIVVTEVYSELKIREGEHFISNENAPEILRNAAYGANTCLRLFSEENRETHGMGATLVAIIFHDCNLNWISIGDSALFLFRDGKLQRLNENHSFAVELEKMVAEGSMCPQGADVHPDRDCLTSVLCGGEIFRIDCPSRSLRLQGDDIVLLASDGLMSLEEKEIEKLLRRKRHSPSREIAEGLIEEIDRIHYPDQDNLSLVILKVLMRDV